MPRIDFQDDDIDERGDDDYHDRPARQQESIHSPVGQHPDQSPGQRSDGSYGSPNQARQRLITDVYGSDGITGARAGQTADPRWRPSGKNVDEKTKQSQLAMRAMLDQQLMESKRLKQHEEDQRVAREKALEDKIRMAYEAEELEKSKFLPRAFQ